MFESNPALGIVFVNEQNHVNDTWNDFIKYYDSFLDLGETVIKEGIKKSNGNTIIVMDTDFNHKPTDAVLLFQVARFVDLSIGSRFIFGGGMSNTLRYYLSYVYNVMMRYILGTRIDDNLSGFFAIKRSKLSELEFDKIFWGYGDYFFRLIF